MKINTRPSLPPYSEVLIPPPTRLYPKETRGNSRGGTNGVAS